MDEKDFSKLLDNIYNLKPEQLEKVFQTFHEMFSSGYYRHSREIPNAAVTWRMKQAWLLLKHRNDKPLPPRR